MSRIPAHKYPVHDGYTIVEEYIIPEHLYGVVSDALMRNMISKIVPGITADQLLAILPRFLMEKEPEIIGLDADGMILEWHYPNVIFTFAYAVQDYESAYCIQQIQVTK